MAAKFLPNNGFPTLTVAKVNATFGFQVNRLQWPTSVLKKKKGGLLLATTGLGNSLLNSHFSIQPFLSLPFCLKSSKPPCS